MTGHVDRTGPLHGHASTVLRVGTVDSPTTTTLRRSGQYCCQNNFNTPGPMLLPIPDMDIRPVVFRAGLALNTRPRGGYV
ncbi:hypothetical protein [Actinomadura rubteroloni]|uniref:hypothetical protein n=1 Tax=Actinomadura rubteroloni TaxID=1926885 RepID=UPI0011AFE329|nr:hypothetical protein [Actinomadura rubteroloni]